MSDKVTPCDEFIEKMERILPEICETSDLIAVGIFRSIQSAFYARDHGDTPDYFQLVRRIVYPKKAVIKWLKEKKHEKLCICQEDTNPKRIRKEKIVVLQPSVACNSRT